MKQGKKLTREMKKILTKNGYNADEYLYSKNTPKLYEFVHKVNGKRLIIEK